MSFQNKVTTILILSIVSTALSMLKIPGPAGSIVLDSAPAFFASLIFSPIVGGFVGLFGHLGFAVTGNFPYGGLHIWIALEMFVLVVMFGYIAKIRNTIGCLLISGIITAFLNGVGAPMLLTITPVFHMEYNTAKGLIPLLLLVAGINILLAIVTYLLIIKTKK